MPCFHSFWSIDWSINDLESIGRMGELALTAAAADDDGDAD